MFTTAAQYTTKTADATQEQPTTIKHGVSLPGHPIRRSLNIAMTTTAPVPQLEQIYRLALPHWHGIRGQYLSGIRMLPLGFISTLPTKEAVPINVQIKATNATNATTGAKWNLTGSSGLDNFSLQYKKSGDVSWTTINLTYDTFMLNLPATGIDWLTFDLNLIMATTSSTGDPLSLTITFKSVAA